MQEFYKAVYWKDGGQCFGEYWAFLGFFDNLLSAMQANTGGLSNFRILKITEYENKHIEEVVYSA